jgi:hypothetical protein
VLQSSLHFKSDYTRSLIGVVGLRSAGVVKGYIWFGVGQIRKAGNYNIGSVIDNKMIVRQTNESYFLQQHKN